MPTVERAIPPGPTPTPASINPDGTPGNVAPGGAIESAWGNAVADAIQDILAMLVPIGSIVAWATSAAPAKWIIADGVPKSRSAFPDLFAVFGTAWGVGDGSTTFGIPNLTARFAVGRASGDPLFGTLGQSGGGRDAVLPAHVHNANHDHPLIGSTTADIVRESGIGDAKLYAANSNPGVVGYGPYSAAQVFAEIPPHNFDTDQRGVAATDGRIPPYIVVNYIIKASK